MTAQTEELTRWTCIRPPKLRRPPAFPSARVDALVAMRASEPVSAPVRRSSQPIDAIAAVRALRADGGPQRGAALRSARPSSTHRPRLPIAVSSAFHAGLAASLILISTMGLPQAAEASRCAAEPVTTRLVFIATPGTRRRRWRRRVAAANAAAARAAERQELTRQPDAGPKAAQAGRAGSGTRRTAAAAAGETGAASARGRSGRNGCGERARTAPGVIDTPAPQAERQPRPGSRRRRRNRNRYGLGSGDGSGIGEGSGGGMGGGPYRPGSGVTPPRSLRK